MYHPNDPRSLYYKRSYNKTPIKWKRFIIIIMMNVFIIVIFLTITKNIRFLLLLELFYIAIIFKYIIIFLIKIYQKLAPISIRSKCRFEPSCSNYMLTSLEKYGLLKGLIKGVKRLNRCNINNGGYDYP